MIEFAHVATPLPWRMATAGVGSTRFSIVDDAPGRRARAILARVAPAQGWACGGSHALRGLATLVHRNRPPVLAEQELGKGGIDFSLPAHLLDQGQHGVDGRGLDVDEPPHFLDDGEKRIDLKRPPLFKVLEHRRAHRHRPRR